MLPILSLFLYGITPNTLLTPSFYCSNINGNDPKIVPGCDNGKTDVTLLSSPGKKRVCSKTC